MSVELQEAKGVVLNYHGALEVAEAEEVSDLLGTRTHPNWLWRGMHPFNEQVGAQSVAETFWKPLKQSFSRLQRRTDIFIAGANEMDGGASVWVISMGHLMGLFDQPWLGIRPSQRIAMLPFAEFNKVEGGKITETAMFCDIPSVMIQAGQNPFPPQTGAHLVYPGPRTNDGVLLEQQDPEIGVQTLAAINYMLNQPRGWDKPQTMEERRADLLAAWDPDMVWWGPSGIGATYTTDRYLQQHADPFLIPFRNERRHNGHLCRLAEGKFGGFFGWPSMTLRSEGGFLGMPAGHKAGDMRIVDMYRAEGNKLVENWIFIDLLHYLYGQGLDILGRMEKLSNYET